MSAGRVGRGRSRAVPRGRGRGIRRGGQATAVGRGRGGQSTTHKYTRTAIINGKSYIKTIHKHNY